MSAECRGKAASDHLADASPAKTRHDGEECGTITVRFLGGSLVPGLPRHATIQVSGPITVAELACRLEPVVGVADLRAKFEQHYAVLVNGTSIQHQAGWSTEVTPGSDVAVVAPMGGGGPDR